MNRRSFLRTLGFGLPAVAMVGCSVSAEEARGRLATPGASVEFDASAITFYGEVTIAGAQHYRALPVTIVPPGESVTLFS